MTESERPLAVVAGLLLAAALIVACRPLEPALPPTTTPVQRPTTPASAPTLARPDDAVTPSPAAPPTLARTATPGSTPTSPPPTDMPAADIRPGLWYRAALVDGSVLTVGFAGDEGEALSVELRPGAGEPGVTVRVLSPQGQVLAYGASGSGRSGAPVAEMWLPFSGRYRLEFTPSGSGESEFRLVPVAVEDLTGGADFGDQAGGDRTGRLVAPGVFHTYRFRARAGDLVTLRVEPAHASSGLRVGLVLLGPDGGQEAFVNGAAGVGAVLDEYRIGADGIFTAIVFSPAGDSGVYDLVYRRWE